MSELPECCAGEGYPGIAHDLLTVRSALAAQVALTATLREAANELIQTWRDSADCLGPEWLGMARRVDALRAALAVPAPTSGLLRLGDTTFQWLIERGQPESQVPTVWLEHSGRHPASHKHWTTVAHEAAMFPSREAAEDYIREQSIQSARAVEHGFMARTSETP